MSKSQTTVRHMETEERQHILWPVVGVEGSNE